MKVIRSPDAGGATQTILRRFLGFQNRFHYGEHSLMTSHMWGSGNKFFRKNMFKSVSKQPFEYLV